MRNKFTEWIEQGVAKFEYTHTNNSLPEDDFICRTYNNIYAIPTDTHMSCLDDGNRVITGHMIDTPQWELFCQNSIWKFVDFRDSGVGSLCQFLYNNGLQGSVQYLNNDVVYMVKPFEDKEMPYTPVCYTSESKIPQPISILSKNNNSLDIQECFTNSLVETLNNLNESVKVKGNEWISDGEKIIGIVGDKIIFIK